MKNDFIHIENFKPGDQSATMRLNRPIHSDPSKGITGESFSREHDFLVANGVKELLVTINSIGGNVFQGLEIFSTIQDSPMNTETRVVGIAASMAGVISQAGKKRTIKEHALFHAHSPRPEAGKNVGAEMLQLAYNQLKTIFKSNTSMDESKVDNILSNETFMPAVVAESNGLFDEILPSNAKVPAVAAEMDAAELMDVFNSLEIEPNKMEKLNSILGIGANADEKAMIDAVVSLQAKAAENAELKAKNEGLTETVANLETSLNDANKAKATALVENAISAGKIGEAEKEMWVENAINSFESTSKMLAGLKVVSASRSIMEDEAIENGGASDTENRKDWGFEQWSKNDPSGLQKMQVENSAKYQTLFDEYVGE